MGADGGPTSGGRFAATGTGRQPTMAETAQLPEAVPPPARASHSEEEAMGADGGATAEGAAAEGDLSLLLDGSASKKPLTTRPLVVDGSVSQQSASVTWLVSLGTQESGPPRFELQYGAPALGRWRTLEKKDMTTEEVVTDGQLAFPSATGAVPAKKYTATVWVTNEKRYVLRVRARYGEGTWSKWSDKSDTVVPGEAQSRPSEAESEVQPELEFEQEMEQSEEEAMGADGGATAEPATAEPEPEPEPAESDDESVSTAEPLIQDGRGQSDSTAEGDNSYIHVDVTGYEPRGSGKDAHVVWRLRVTHGDRRSVHELERRFSGIIKFNKDLLNLKHTPQALRTAGGKWKQKSVPGAWCARAYSFCLHHSHDQSKPPSPASVLSHAWCGCAGTNLSTIL